MTGPRARTRSRREFLQATGSCAAHLALMGASASVPMRALWAQQSRFAVVAQEPWGRLERIADGIWALVSTPLSGDRTTLCNGGIIAGVSGVMIIEAFGTDNGARWMAAQARALTGRAPTHVLLTHYHSDHSAGIRGSLDTRDVALHGTARTLDLIGERNAGAPVALLRDAHLIEPTGPTSLDLGGRRVSVTPQDGHTESDVSIRVEDPAVVFCGDLVWNGMFPNYVDAVPSHLTRSVRALRASGAATFVPGHGTIATPAELDRYLALLDSVEAAAGRAVERGITAEAAGAEYTVPAALGEWTLFNPKYFERAIGAWMKELRPAW